MLLIDNQGATHDGGIYDDPADDRLGPAQLGQRGPHLERRLPPRQPARQLYTATETAAGKVVETAGQVAEGANEAAKGIANPVLKWCPRRVARGHRRSPIGATAVVLAASNGTATAPATPPTRSDRPSAPQAIDEIRGRPRPDHRRPTQSS
jgi:hypothetical protein